MSQSAVARQVRPDAAPQHRSCRTHASTIAEFVLPPNFPVPEHKHTPPHIVVMLGGAMTDVDGETLAPCVTGSMRYAPGGDNHRIRVSPRGAHCLVIEAGGFPELRLQQRVYVDPSDCADLVTRLQELLFREPTASPAKIEDSVLSLFCRVRALDRGRPDAPWVEDVVRMLDSLESSAAPLAEAARLVGRSPGLVARAFRARHAVSIHRYYRRRQVDRAWALLGESDSLSAIAHRCGFSDQSHMSRTFVRETGEAPSRIRARMLEGLDRNWYRANPLRVIGPM
jgi:AraC-like DNA-binding protein